MARLTATTNAEITYQGVSDTFDPENNLMFAVVFKKVGEKWRPISGSPATGWTVAADDSWESIQEANRYRFMLSSSGSYTAMIDELPGDIKKYVDAAGADGSYRIAYYFSNQKDPQAIDGSNTFEIMSPMNRVAAVNLYVPNIRNDLTVQKLDQNGNLIADDSATFALRPASSAGTYDPSATAVQTQTTSGGEATFTAIPNGTYYLVETVAPEGYTANATPVKVIVNDTGVYANAGTAEDGISVERGVGRLVNSMAQFASKDTVDTTLNQIVAKFYTTETEIHEGFPWREITGTFDDAAFSPVSGVAYHPAYSVTGTSLQDAQWYLFGTAPSSVATTPVGMHLAHLTNHPGGLCDGLYQTTVTLKDGGQGITAQETDTGWSALLVEQCMFHTRDSGTPYTNLTGDNLTDLTALFTGDVTVKVKNDPIVGNLAIQKTVAGNAGDTGREWNFTVTLSDKGISGTYGDMSFTDGVATFTLKHNQAMTATDLPAGISYTVTEAEASQDGYTTRATGASGQIPAEGTATAAFTNMKSIPRGNLSVSKTVSGSNPPSKTAFGFTVILSDRTVDGRFGEMTFRSGVAEFTLRHGETVTASGLPAGVGYLVQEEANEAYTVSSEGAEGLIEPDGTATARFVNRRVVLPHKTGDDSHTGLCLVLMPLSLCCAALLAGLRKRGGRAGR